MQRQWSNSRNNSGKEAGEARRRYEASPGRADYRCRFALLIVAIPVCTALKLIFWPRGSKQEPAEVWLPLRPR
jgi:hypothetical protein